jgi:YD repeat-containing protein
LATTASLPLRVQVKDPNGGIPILRALVRFAITQAPNKGDASVPAAAESSNEGFADGYFTANATTGLYKITATAEWAPGASALFDETATAAAALPFDTGKLMGVEGACAGRLVDLDSVNFAIGNNFKTEEDYGAAGAMNPVRFARHYNSVDTRVGVMGKSWRHHFERSITVTTSKGKPPATVATVARPEGSILTYTLTNGQWVGDPDVTARLESITGGFRYTCDSDRVEEYDSGGKLLSIALRGGRLSQHLTYDSSGRLATVIDASGRVLRFKYDKSKRLSVVADPSGKEYLFSYNANGELVSVTGPDRYKRTFAYYDGTLLAYSRGGESFPIQV